MVSRREFGFTALAAFSGGATLSLCSSSNTSQSYAAAVQNTWWYSQGEPDTQSMHMRELVRYATLAAVAPQHPMLAIWSRRYLLPISYSVALVLKSSVSR